MSTVPEHLRPWLEQIRHRIDAATPQIPDTAWSRTEIGALSVACWLQGLSEGITLEGLPGLPPNVAHTLYADPARRKSVATVILNLAESLLAEVDQTG